MDKVPRSSFIPKQVVGVTPKTIRRKRVFNVFGTLSVIFLLAAIIAAGGAFGYRLYLESRLESQKKLLEEQEKRFDASQITEIRNFDRRLDAVSYLLDNHGAPSKVFAALESVTERNVQYTSFNFEQRASGDVTLDINGITSDFDKVALQLSSYFAENLFADVVITKVGQQTLEGDEEEEVVSQDDVVGFHLLANISAANIAYTGERGSLLPAAELFDNLDEDDEIEDAAADGEDGIDATDESEEDDNLDAL